MNFYLTNVVATNRWHTFWSHSFFAFHKTHWRMTQQMTHWKFLVNKYLPLQLPPIYISKRRFCQQYWLIYAWKKLWYITYRKDGGKYMDAFILFLFPDSYTKVQRRRTSALFHGSSPDHWNLASTKINSNFCAFTNVR